MMEILIGVISVLLEADLNSRTISDSPLVWYRANDHFVHCATESLRFYPRDLATLHRIGNELRGTRVSFCSIV